MKTRIFKSTFIVLLTISFLSFDIPKGWFAAGSDPDKYEMGIDKTIFHDGKNAATIKSVEEKIKGFGTLMQDSRPDKFLGKRVRMSGYVKSENVKDWAGLWFRVDPINSKGENQTLSFDNMQDRSIKKTTDWTKYEIVLDVPTHASNFAFGALLSGTGQIWFDNVTFEIVDDTVKPTGSINAGKTSSLQLEPSNLDFEN